VSTKKEIRWVIIGNCGLYTGQWLTRRDAIEQHCREIDYSWEACRKKGDRAVKATIIWRKSP
jgi:hypothetical protein